MSVNFTPQKSAKGAKHYFSHGDYLGTEIVGDWHGKLAAELDLVGPVDQSVFELLCDNRKPDGSRLTPYDTNSRVVGMDITFNCPKSLSVLYQHTQDERILTLFRRSVKETMTEIETEMCQPVTRSGEQRHPVTGNMIAAEFIHLTARPVDGLPDPHLHAHLFVFNATKNRQDGVIRSGYFRQIKTNAPLHEARFHSRLAFAVQHELGFGVSRDGKGFWRVSGVPKSVEKKFSRRTEKIEAVAKSLGIEGDKAKVADLAKVTREAKSTHHTPEELREIWYSAMSDTERQALDGAREFEGRNTIAAKAAVNRALTHELERASIVSEQQLTIGSLKRSFGSCSAQEIEAEIQQNEGQRFKGYFRGEAFLTSPKVFDEEQTLLRAVRGGRGSFRSLSRSPFEILDPRVRKNMAQADAVRHALQSNDQVISIIGSAGVGKTTLMKEAVRAILQNGKTVFG